MSLIFEALRRSESERAGHSLDECTATELLRAAEKDTPEARVKKVEGTPSVQVDTGTEAIPQRSCIPDKSLLASTVTVPRDAKENIFDHAERNLFEPAASHLPTSDKSGVFNGVQEVRGSASPDSRLICLMDEWSLAAEKFRVLAFRLRQWSQKRTLKNVLVTSTVAGEGKSFVSSNLAITMSRKRGQRVLLMDGDLRRPVLSERLGLGQLPGLSECLKSGAPLPKSIYHLQEFGFWFFPSGNQSDNALELMQSGHLPEMLDELGKSFDWIIIDSPPLIPLADTAFWSRLTHGTIVVARQGKSERRALQRGLEMLDKSSIVGVVLNASSSADHKSYYQRYGYGTAPIQSRTPSSGHI